MSPEEARGLQPFLEQFMRAVLAIAADQVRANEIAACAIARMMRRDR